MTRPQACRDCGADTCPTAWGADAEWYMVHDGVWAAAGMQPDGGCLCIGCLEVRLGRRLTPADFTDALTNDLTVNPETSDKAFAFRTQRFIDRLTGAPVQPSLFELETT